jgi:HEAT repeat protein
VKPLLEVLSNAEEKIELRCHAAESLGLLRDKTAIKDLVVTLRDKSPEIRFWSIYAIGEIGDGSAIPQLKYIASNDDASIDKYGSLKEEANRVIELLGEHP